MAEISYDGKKYLYKFTLAGARALYGDYAFPSPRKDKSADWMPAFIRTGTSVKRKGYYGVTLDNIVDWTGPELWLIESKDGWRPDVDGDKMVCRQARLVKRITPWTRKSMIAFACDCVERLLPTFKTTYPHDHRPQALLAEIRKFIAGPESVSSLHGSVAEAEEAAQIAGLASYQARKEKRDATSLLDAAHAARALADIGKGLTSQDGLDYRLFIVRSENNEERSWQRERKLAYIHGAV